MNPRTARHVRALRRRVSLLVSGALAAGLIQAAASPAQAAPVPASSAVSTDHPVKGGSGSVAEPRTKDDIPAHPVTPRHSWPKAERHAMDIDAATGTGAKHLRQVGTGPVSLAPAAAGKPSTRATGKTGKKEVAPVPARRTVTTEVVGRARTEKAGVKGLLFTLTAEQRTSPGRGETDAVSVGVDYSSFVGAYGGSYASRLHLVEYPACVLTSPEKDVCRTATPVETHNDTSAQSLRASAVTLAAATPTVLAAEADEKSEKGDYKATSLSDSASWNTNLNSGDFNWAYDFTTPSVPGGLAPSLKLGYSSGSLDGRTSNTNNQGSWVGDGFDLSTGSIERRYQPCADDGEKKNADGNRPGDLCWNYDNAFLTFNGKGGELVPTGTDSFKLQQDDGTRIDRLRDTARANGDADGEYWRVTTPDGTRYYYGYNRLPGFASGDEATNSVWSVPVFGNNAGEPCHKDDFASSYCAQGWRWNLDYVVDTHGNAITYRYTKEANSYGRNLKADDDTSYTRGGYLDRIDYGLKSDKIYGAKPLAQIFLSNAERCLPQSGVTCETSAIKDKSTYWYDTPWDLNCDSGTKCDQGRLSPSFWTRKRLTGISTQVLKPDGTYGKVDSWSLNHKWGMADTDYQLLLDSIQHTGQAASPAISLPKTTFTYTQLANRLDKTGDGYAPFIKYRLSTIDGETGSKVDVDYSAPGCDASALPEPETNTTRCFPQYLNQDPDATTAEVQWFNKYVTTQVTATDRTGGAEEMITRYAYEGPAAWHYNDSDGLVRKKYRTWDQWRGYGWTRVLTGSGDGMKSQEDTYFLRGMDGDRKDAAGGSKSVSVVLGNGEGDPITDLAPYAGLAYKTVAYDKPGGKVLAKSVSRPWHHETAKKTRDWGTVTADFTGTDESTEWTSLDDGAGVKWRTTKSETTYDTVAGRAILVNDLGDTSTATDDACTRTTYTDDILTLVSRVETLSKACTATVDRTKDVVSDVRTAYDGGSYGAAPTKGDATRAATLKSFTGTKATYLESQSTYDAYGRVLTATDLSANVTVDGDAAPVRAARADGRTTTTAFSPGTGFPTQIKTTTPPAKAGVASTSLTTSQTLEPLRALPVTTTDANGNDTVTAYDALGRASKVWLADRHTTDLPSYEYTYQIKEGQPTAVGTRVIGNNDAQTRYSYTLYDGMMRERQTQTPGPEGGRLVADTFYDGRGLIEKTFAPYFTTGTTSTSLFVPDQAYSVQSQTHNVYDGLGRTVQAQQIAGNGDGGAVLSTTKTIYGGDRTTVLPPQGGTASTTVTDARGRTTELRQLHTHDVNAVADVTHYTYDARSQLATVADPAGNKWTYTYDQMGRQVESTDPDKGTTTTAYDDRGQVDHTTAANKISLYTVYDGMGRRTQLREGSTSGTLRAEWTYDSSLGGKGLPSATIRYDKGQAYKSQVTYYDDMGRALKSSVTIPSTEGVLGKTYAFSTSYLRSGLVSGTGRPGAGGLAGGAVSYSYDDDTLLPTRVSADGKLAGLTVYNQVGKPDVITVAPEDSSKSTMIKNSYEWGTQRLSEQVVSRQEQPGIDRDAVYHYDEAGNITAVADTSRTGVDNQCYTYDYLGRLTEAWAQATTTCSGSAGAATLGGPAPYWQSFTYDVTGNRTTQTQHDTTGQSGKDTKTTYTYPVGGATRPHTLTQAQTAGPAGTRLDEYHYDDLGNTDKRPGQKLNWDAEGHLASVTEDNGDTTSYLYDADGSRLIARSPTETTLYLGDTEVTLAKGAAKAKATRYTDIGSGITAIQADDGTYSYTLPDHQGTGQLAVQAESLAIQQRRTTPFGQPRGTTPADWPGTKGFVGGTDDTEETGLQHLGAREYDPQTGRFVSVDPIMDLTDPQQINGYAYANNSPVTGSDPTGLMRVPLDTGGGGYSGKPSSGGSRSHSSSPSSCPSAQATKKTNSISTFFNSIGSGISHGTDKVVGGVKHAASATADWWDDNKETVVSVGTNLVVDAGCGVLAVGAGAATAGVGAVAVGAGCGALGGMAGSFAGNLVDDDADHSTSGVLKDEAEGSIAGGIGGATGGALGTLMRTLKKGAKVTKTKSPKSSSTPCHSFLPGTGVLLADGAHKAIEKLKLGDEILATDPETGVTEKKKVVSTIVTEDDKAFTDLKLSTGDKNSSITATDTHPFWVPDLKQWVSAGDLQAGQWLRTSSGSHVQIARVSHYTKRQRTHDLTIDDVHTYYVLAGATPVLVHNCGGANGGKYGDLQPAGAGNEINHIPAHASTPLSKYSGPSIRMDYADHRAVYSTGSSLESKAWRMRQKELIDGGDFRGAMQMDVDDIRNRFGSKYDGAITEMWMSLSQNKALRKWASGQNP